MLVALCDDENDAIDYLKNLLAKNVNINHIRCFQKIDGFFDAVENGERFDIVFMDIDWPGEHNGIDAASALAKISPRTQVIYVTGQNDRYSQSIFLKDANLCGYLVKPVSPALLDALIEKAKKAVSSFEAEKLIIQQKGILYAIPYRDICYLDSRGHQLNVHTVNDSILCYERLEDIKQRLPNRFFQCHKSFIVNMDVIWRIDKNRILLNTGEEIPISKSKYAETRSTYFRYMGETI